METQEIYDIFVSIFNEHLEDGILPAGSEDIQITTYLKIDSIGLDSISKVALLASFMDKTDSYIPDTILLNDPTLWEIAQRLREYVI
jgi:acyl carrier protein